MLRDMEFGRILPRETKNTQTNSRICAFGTNDERSCSKIQMAPSAAHGKKFMHDTELLKKDLLKHICEFVEPLGLEASCLNVCDFSAGGRIVRIFRR